MQSLDMDHLFLGYEPLDWHGDTHQGATPHCVRHVLQHYLPKLTNFSSEEEYRQESKPASTQRHHVDVHRIRHNIERRLNHVTTRGAGNKTVVTLSCAWHGTRNESGFRLSRAKLVLASMIRSCCTLATSIDCFWTITGKARQFKITSTLNTLRTSQDSFF